MSQLLLTYTPPEERHRQFIERLRGMVQEFVARHPKGVIHMVPYEPVIHDILPAARGGRAVGFRPDDLNILAAMPDFSRHTRVGVDMGTGYDFNAFSIVWASPPCRERLIISKHRADTPVFHREYLGTYPDLEDKKP